MAYMIYTMVYQQVGMLDSGLLYAEKAIRILPLVPKKIIETGVCYELKGMMLRAKNEHGDAIAAYMESIATRIEYLKGTVAYYSSPGKGTSVNIWVPIV